MIFGYELRLPYDMKFKTPTEKPTLINEFVMKMRNRLRRIYKIFKNRLHLASDWMKTRYDVHANSLGFSTGDHVWLYNLNCSKARTGLM